MKQKVAWQASQWKTKMYEKLMEINEKVENTYIANQVTENEQLFNDKETIAINYCPPIIDSEMHKQVLKEIITILKEYMPEEKTTLEELEEIDASLLSQITTEDDSFDFDEFANPSYARTVLIYSLKPFLKVYGKQFSVNNKTNEWKLGHCPVCGHNAIFATLSERENGKRYLICPLCETKWPFNRVACPYCLEKDPEKLGYFKVEEEKQYRVNFCLTCKGYIKTCDERSGSLLTDNILLEDAKTSYLDHLAQKEGFKR